MNCQDFKRLQGLIAKLNAATTKASRTDGSFRKYHNQSMEAIKELPFHLKRLEQGLKTAKIISADTDIDLEVRVRMNVE